MRTFLDLLLALSITAAGCLPNPQSTWGATDKGDKGAVLDDETIQAASMVADGNPNVSCFDCAPVVVKRQAP